MNPFLNCINICFVSDGNFAPWLTVAALSAKDNLRPGWRMDINVLCDSSFSVSLRAKVEHSLSQKINWFEIDCEKFAGFSKTRSGPLVPFYKFLIPQILPSDQEKTILLDCDILVKMDLAELWAKEFGTNWLLACQDRAIPTVGSLGGLAGYRKLGLKASLPYFNSGVMLIDLREWRRNRVTERLLDFSAQNLFQLRCFDQDALNFICRNNWGRLPGQWNTIFSVNKTSCKKNLSQVYDKGTIIHFAGFFKPWKMKIKGCNEFYDMLGRTDWRDLRLPKKFRFFLASFYLEYLRRYCYFIERCAFHIGGDLQRIVSTYLKRKRTK
jgi:lipopolysaccharide biosynthesis glycosyltransferase